MAEPMEATPTAAPELAGAADPLLLPEEILAQIFGYLTPQELGRLSLVSKVLFCCVPPLIALKGWKCAAEEDPVWLDLLSEVPDTERCDACCVICSFFFCSLNAALLAS